MIKMFLFKIFYLDNKMEYNNYQQMTVPTLKNMARERGLRGYSRLKKPELIRKLREATPPREPTSERERGLRGYSRLSQRRGRPETKY